MSSEKYFKQLWEDALDKYLSSTDKTSNRKALLKEINTVDDFQKHLEQLAATDGLQNRLQVDQDKFQSFRNKHSQCVLR